MLKLRDSAKFRKDLKRAIHSGRFNAARFNHVLTMLRSELPLEAKHRDHLLSSDWEGCRECHVCPDLLLIYFKEPESIVLIGLGSHAELFG